MKRFLIGAALCALVATPVLADEPTKVTTEPVKLSLSQMDKLTAGRVVQFNATRQTATAVAVGGASLGSAFSSNALAIAANFNRTRQACWNCN